MSPGLTVWDPVPSTVAPLPGVGVAPTSIVVSPSGNVISYVGLLGSNPGIVVPSIVMSDKVLSVFFSFVTTTVYVFSSPLSLVTIILNVFSPGFNVCSPVSPDTSDAASSGVAVIVIFSMSFPTDTV